MMLDLVDTAFIERWRARPAAAALPPSPREATGRCAAVDEEVGEQKVQSTGFEGRSAAAPEHASDPARCPGTAGPVPIVERLLAAAPQEWAALAGHVERARQRGRRVIAIAGCERGEGRTTLLRCLAATLRDRGRDVVCVEPADVAAARETSSGTAVGGGSAHDRRIVLVDAGIWFPPGPIRRQRLVVASLGSEAAILARRVDRPGAGSRAAMLAALGIEVLGEVVTFTPPSAPTAQAALVQEGAT